jgi:hypothetical protein
MTVIFIERPHSVLPEILESIRGHLGVSYRVHDIFVTHVVLQGPGIMPIVSELVAGGMPEHVGMNWEWKPCRFAGPGDRFQEPCSRGGTTPLGDEHISRFDILAA